MDPFLFWKREGGTLDASAPEKKKEQDVSDRNVMSVITAYCLHALVSIRKESFGLTPLIAASTVVGRGGSKVCQSGGFLCGAGGLLVVYIRGVESWC